MHIYVYMYTYTRNTLNGRLLRAADSNTIYTTTIIKNAPVLDGLGRLSRRTLASSSR